MLGRLSRGLKEYYHLSKAKTQDSTSLALTECYCEILECCESVWLIWNVDSVCVYICLLLGAAWYLQSRRRWIRGTSTSAAHGAISERENWSVKGGLSNHWPVFERKRRISRMKKFCASSCYLRVVNGFHWYLLWWSLFLQWQLACACRSRLWTLSCSRSLRARWLCLWLR